MDENYKSQKLEIDDIVVLNQRAKEPEGLPFMSRRALENRKFIVKQIKVPEVNGEKWKDSPSMLLIDVDPAKRENQPLWLGCCWFERHMKV